MEWRGGRSTREGEEGRQEEKEGRRERKRGTTEEREEGGDRGKWTKTNENKNVTNLYCIFSQNGM